MKTTLLSRLLPSAAAAFLLAAGAVPAAAADPAAAPSGWIVLSLSQERGISTVAIAVQPRPAKATAEPKAPPADPDTGGDPKAAKGMKGLGILTKSTKTPKTTDSAKLPRIEAAFTLDPPPAELQKWDGRSGVVRVLKVPAGAYSLINFRLEHPESKGKWFARDNYDIRFGVKENEVTYLGEFEGTYYLNKRSTATHTVPQSYFIVADQKERDLALAEAAHPEIRGKPVTSIAPVKARGKSHFQVTRIPDKE